MGSYSASETKDQRRGIDGDITGQVTAPQSQIANPLGIAIGGAQHGGATTTVEYGDITFNEYPAELNDLVLSIMESSQKGVEAAGDTSTELANPIEGIKTPLSQYVPLAVLALVLVLALKFGSK